MVLLRLTVKVVPRSLENEEKGDGSSKCTSFLMVIRRPEQMSLGELAWKVSEQWKKLRPEAGPLKIKKLLDDNHDTDELDADLTVSDVFIDYGKAYADGLDQRGVLRVLQQPTSIRLARYGSVVQDWDNITSHYSGAAARSSKRTLAPFSAANGLHSALSVKPHADVVNGDTIPFEVAESVQPLCSIEEEAAGTETNRHIEPPLALGGREQTQETTANTASKLRLSPLDAFPSSVARVSTYSRAKQGQNGNSTLAGALAAEINTALVSQQAAIWNPAERKAPLSAADSRPSPSISRPQDHYAKRPRVTDSDELSDQPASSTTKQRRTKRAKRQKLAETPAPEPEDDGMADFQSTKISTRKKTPLVFQARMLAEKENEEQSNTSARPSSKESMRAGQLVIDLTGTPSTERTNSKPKSDQIGLGITASPPKKRTVDKLDIQKDDADTFLTPKSPSRLNRPRSSGVCEQSTGNLHDIPFAPSSVKNARQKKNATPTRKVKRDAGEKTAYPRKNDNYDSSSDRGLDKDWTNKFDCTQPECNFSKLIANLETTIQAAKAADASQKHIPIMEKLLEAIPLFQHTIDSTVRKNTRRRIVRARETLAKLKEPKLAWEEPSDIDEDGDVNMIYASPRSSSVNQGSGDEGDEAQSKQSSSESDHEEAVDEESLVVLEKDKTDEDEDEDKDGEEAEDDKGKDQETSEDDDESEGEKEDGDKEDDYTVQARMSPSLSDVANERLSTTGSRRSSKKIIRAESPSIYSVALSSSEAPESQPEDSGSSSESASEDEEQEETTPRPKTSIGEASRESSSAPSQSHEFESVDKHGGESESRATTPSERSTDTKPSAAQEEEEVSSSSEEEDEEEEEDDDDDDEDDDNADDEKTANAKEKPQKSESSSSEDSTSADEEDTQSKADTSVKPTVKKQVTVFDESDSDSDSSSTSEGSDIHYRKSASDSFELTGASASCQHGPSKVPPPSKKAHILKRSQTPLHKPFRTSSIRPVSASNKSNPASSPIVEDKSTKSDFITFSQPAPASNRTSPGQTNDTNPQITPNGSSMRRNTGLRELVAKHIRGSMFGL